MNGRNLPPEKPSRRPLRVLAVLVLAFLLGIGCTRVFRFTVPLLNYIFVAALLCFPVTAIRPVSQLSRWPKLAGFILLVPLLLVCVLLMVTTITCDRLELHHGRADSEIQVVDTVEQDGYRVLLLWNIGPPLVSPWLWVEQEKLIVPGLQLVKIVEYFDRENPVGKLTSEGVSTVRLRLPPSDYRPEAVNRVYRLKRWVYF